MPCGFARADRIKHPIAVFSGLDKITGRIISFEVATDETVQFGSLQITERACYTRPSTETPQTITFVEVDEIDAADKTKTPKQIFAGWMFAASPGLHALEHPVYDIWLNDCKGGKEVLPSPDTAAGLPATPDNAKEASDIDPSEAPKPSPAKSKSKPKPKPVQPPPDDSFDDPLAPPAMRRAPPDDGPVEVGPPPGLIPDAPPPERRRRKRVPPPADAPPDGFY